jgi:hypothetical protein
MNNKTKNLQDKDKKKKKHVRFSKKLSRYHTIKNRRPIKIPPTSRCAEKPFEIKSALVSNVI